jgi:hypothetical protein
MSERPTAYRIWHTNVKAKHFYGQEYKGKDKNVLTIKQLK